MLIEPIYYVIFYDTDKPKNHHYAMNKRVCVKQFVNIIDGFENKQVELKDSTGNVELYQIISVSTFTITNTVDNHVFAVCDVQKI